MEEEEGGWKRRKEGGRGGSRVEEEGGDRYKLDKCSGNKNEGAIRGIKKK